MVKIKITSINAATRARARIIEEEGPTTLNQHTVEEWAARMKMGIEKAMRNFEYGNIDHGLKCLTHALGLGLCCLDQHLAGAGILEPEGRKGSIPDSEDLRIIAQYEMYAALEMRYMQRFTETYLNCLDEDAQQLIDRYMQAKLQVLASDKPLALQLKKNTGAEG